MHVADARERMIPVQRVALAAFHDDSVWLWAVDRAGDEQVERVIAVEIGGRDRSRRPASTPRDRVVVDERRRWGKARARRRRSVDDGRNDPR